MGESINRALTPTVGQNGLQRWLASPELTNPLRTQSTSLQPCQELLPFQQKFRLHQDSQQLGGVETVTRFDVTVPENECWEVDWLFVEHDASSTIVWQARMLRNPFFNRQAVVAQRRITIGVMQSLIGGDVPRAAVVGDPDMNPREPLKLLPGANLEIQNVDAMAQPDVGRIAVIYREVPLPLEVQAPPVGLWQATTL